MGRRAKKKVSRAVKRALEKKQKAATKPLTPEPLSERIPAIMKPPEVVQKPLPMLPPAKQLSGDSGEQTPHALPGSSSPKSLSGSSGLNTNAMLDRIGHHTLIGSNPDGGNEFWIQLKQDILGGLQIRISIQNGELTASMLAPSQTIAYILEQRTAQLEQHLQNRGFQVKRLQVIVRSTESPQEVDEDEEDDEDDE